jgi:endonuclease-3 related protein
MANLKVAGALSAAALRRLSLTELARLIRPSGYYNAKALKLKSLAHWLGESYDDDLERMLAGEPARLRGELLAVHGIGPETADSILLYGAGRPVFVIDAYTRRILGRLGLAPASSSYSALQVLFMDNLPPDTQLFQEYHALLVALAKNACRRQPRCSDCCLSDSCPSFNR